MGQIPQVFNGDRLKTEGFVDSLRAYFRLNHEVPALQSYLTKIAFTLTLIQGPSVQEWARQMGRWLDTLNPATDDELDTWNQFIVQFETSFDDTQKVQKARSQLDRLTMKWPEVDQYTMDFEKLTREANYQIGSPETTQMYLKGLPDDVAADVLGPPFIHTYNALKERAAQSVSTRQTLKNLRDGKKNRAAHSGEWQKSEKRPKNKLPQKQYNSSNVPRTHNDVQTPMDLNRIQGNKRQGPRRFQNYTIATAPPVKVLEMRRSLATLARLGDFHFARNCPQGEKEKTLSKHRPKTGGQTKNNLKETEGTKKGGPLPTSRIDTAVAAFTILSQEEKKYPGIHHRSEKKPKKRILVPKPDFPTPALIRALTSERSIPIQPPIRQVSIRVYIHTANKRVEKPQRS